MFMYTLNFRKELSFLKVITLFNALKKNKSQKKIYYITKENKSCCSLCNLITPCLFFIPLVPPLTRDDDDSTDCWEDARVPSLTRPDGKFGDYNCDSSYELISSVLQFMKAKMGDNIDFILWTGYVLNICLFYDY